MAILNWVGAVSTDSTNVANWVDVGTGSAPTSIAATDTLEFKGGVAAGDCLIGQSSLGLLITDEDFARAHKLIFGVGTLQLMQLTLGHEQKIQFTQSSTAITFAGTHPTGAPYYNHPVIFYGDVDYVSSGYAKTTVSFILNNGNGAAAYLTDGELPNVTLNNKFTFNRSDDVDSASTPGAFRAYPESNCCKLTIGSTATFDNTPISYSDTQKHIRVTGDGSSSGQHFACAAAICDFSNAKLTIDAKNSQQMPCTNDTTNFGTTTDFIALLEDVVVGNFSGNANKNIIPEGLTLECASLEIQSGSYLYGGGTNLQTGAKSHIHVIEKPTIRGTWNFEETANGIYSSIGGVSSASIHTLKSDTVHILGKLTVDGLIDPTGLELTPVGSNPGGVANNTLWLDSTDSNKLKLGSSEVSGGGSGDITGVTITTDSGGGSKAEDTGGSADFSILGATGVGVTNSGATITAVAVPAEIDHDSLQNFVAAEHVDWAGASAGTIHASNYTDTNTQLSNAEVVSAVEAESTLVLQSGVTVGTDLKMTTSSDNAIIENVTQDKDIIFQVNDGGSANTEVMRIDGSTSRVGIGETSPDAPLHVKGSGNGTILKIESTSTDSMTPDIEFVNMTAPTAGDNLGNIEYIGKRESSVGADDLTTPVDYARIYAGIDGAEGSTVNSTLAGKIGMQIFHQGARKTMFFMEGHPTGGGFVTVNYNGEDMDFRVHGEDTNNLFFINGGSGDEGVAVGGVTTPKSMFTVDGTITLKERGDATGDTAGYGQVWVHDQNAGELMFTTDAGTDIQLTSGTDGPVFPGSAVSGLNNDAGYLTAATTPTGTFCRWGDIGGDHTDNKATNILVDNWTYSEGSTALRDAMSSGVFTCTAALAGTYLIVSHLMYKTGTLGEADGRLFQIQNNLYYNAGGGTPSSGTLRGFTRHINNDRYSDTVIEGNYLLTLADGDTFGVYGKIGCSTSGTVKISSVNTFTNLHMVKIA